jgi:hypothetical protein
VARSKGGRGAERRTDGRWLEDVEDADDLEEKE